MATLISAETYAKDNSIMINSMVQCSNGDYILVGKYTDDSYTASGYAIRVTPSGSTVWEKIFPSTFSVFFKSIAKISDNSFIAVGSYFYSIFAGNEYTWIVNLDGEGNIISQDAIGTVNIQSDGLDVCSTLDGGYAVSSLIVENTKGSSTIIKFNSANEIEWKKDIKTGVAYSIASTMDGGLILCGSSDTKNPLMKNIFVVKLNTTGDILCERIYTEYEIYVLLNTDIIETKNGHFALVGKSVIMEIDSCGKKLWGIQNTDYNLYSIAENSDGDFAIAGSFIANYVDHSYLACLSRTDYSILWNNTEIVSPSGIAKLIINEIDDYNVCGYAPVNILKSQGFFAVFSQN